MQKGLKKYFWLFALPTLIAFAIAFLVPFVMGIYLSFTKFTTVTNATFVGLDNYKKVFITPEFTNALIFTTKFVIETPLKIKVAFLIEKSYFLNLLYKNIKQNSNNTNFKTSQTNCSTKIKKVVN